MNRKDILRMAREAGFHAWYTQPEEHPDHVAIIERFATLVAAAEREACAKVCESMRKMMDGTVFPSDCADAIRARGQA